MKKLMVLDGNSIVNRAFYGVSQNLTTRDGQPTNAVFGFLAILNKLLDECEPQALCVTFDRKAPTFRHLAYEGYKAQRKGMPDELAVQMPILKDVLDAMDSDNTFRSLYGEVQRLLGRSLNTEELKILLGFVRYLGLTADVISLLVCYCKERARQRGSLRNPSLRTIEKEAYNWAERGIDTVEEAAAFIQAQNVRNSRLSRLMNLIQIRGRSLTAAEERYAQSWLDMGMDNELISMAYERTCLNTGGLNWAYMNKILQRWQQQGFHSAEDVRTGDRKTGVPKGASGQLGEAELEAIQKVLQEG